MHKLLGRYAQNFQSLLDKIAGTVVPFPNIWVFPAHGAMMDLSKIRTACEAADTQFELLKCVWK